MSAFNGLQLLTLPKHMKENAMTTNNSQQSHPDKMQFQFLSFPSKSSVGRSPKLVMMPKVIPPKDGMPLLRLPKNFQHITNKRQNISEGISFAQRCSLPLLKKPKFQEPPNLIKVPIAVERERKKPVLVEIPIRQPQTPLKEIPKPKQYQETGSVPNSNTSAVGTHQLLHAVPKSLEYSENDWGHKKQHLHANGDDVAEQPAHKLYQARANHKAKR